MQLASKRNATAIRSKNGPRRIHSWNVFLVCANQAPPRFPLRLQIIRPFFFFPLLRNSRWNPRWLEFRKIGSKEHRAVQLIRDTGKRRGTSSISEAYVQSTFCACMHLLRHGAETTDWKIVVASWAHSSTGCPR